VNSTSQHDIAKLVLTMLQRPHEYLIIDDRTYDVLLREILRFMKPVGMNLISFLTEGCLTKNIFRAGVEINYGVEDSGYLVGFQSTWCDHTDTGIVLVVEEGTEFAESRMGYVHAVIADIRGAVEASYGGIATYLA
jgi:hypothetical protein